MWPILDSCFKGLQVDVHPHLSAAAGVAADLEVVYEDEWLLVVNKPAGLLSVPGKLDVDSVADRVKRMRPGLRACHCASAGYGHLWFAADCQNQIRASAVAVAVQEPSGEETICGAARWEVNMPPDNCLINYEVGTRSAFGCHPSSALSQSGRPSPSDGQL